MTHFRALCASAFFAVCAVSASATTITLASYGSTAATPAGVDNTATIYLGGLSYGIYPVDGGPSYNIGTGGVWANPTGSSRWVSQDPGNAPGGSNVEVTGVYDYSSTFYIGDASGATGSIEVMADDTTGVFLNGLQITTPAMPTTNGTCDSGTPTCTFPMTYTLTGFVSGVNTLSFDVLQEHGSGEGLDFSGQVNVTPEPGSLLLLGTGLLLMAGFAHSRRVQA